METGINLIAKERQRQIEKEGCDSPHDAGHFYGELADAAVAYALNPNKSGEYDYRIDYWPFESEFFKPDYENRIKELTKAGALIAAEIDRLLNLND